jgi:hypothetical protein
MKHRRCARPCPVTPVRIRSSASRDNRTLIASVRPRDLAGKTRRWLAVELTGELEATGKKTRALDKELTELVTARGSTLPEVYGIGPSGAARLLANAGDIHRFARRDRFASWNGTAPLDASSGTRPGTGSPRPAPALPGREPAHQPGAAHHGGRAAAEPGQGPRLLRRPPGWRHAVDDGHARPQAAPVQCGLLAHAGRPMAVYFKPRFASPNS